MSLEPFTLNIENTLTKSASYCDKFIHRNLQWTNFLLGDIYKGKIELQDVAFENTQTWKEKPGQTW